MRIELVSDTSTCEPVESTAGPYRTFQEGPKTRTIVLDVDDEGAERVHKFLNAADWVETFLLERGEPNE